MDKSKVEIPADLHSWITNFMIRESRWNTENRDKSYALMSEFYEEVPPVLVLNLCKRIARLESDLAAANRRVEALSRPVSEGELYKLNGGIIPSTWLRAVMLFDKCIAARTITLDKEAEA